MRFTLDTNILVYAIDMQAGDRHLVALDLVRRARGRDCIVTLQALAELFRTLTGKHRVHLKQPGQSCRDGGTPCLFSLPTKSA
jgi:predicted nucleic acid-binding protein